MGRGDELRAEIGCCLQLPTRPQPSAAGFGAGSWRQAQVPYAPTSNFLQPPIAGLNDIKEEDKGNKGL